jgi:hypothetical protein
MKAAEMLRMGRPCVRVGMMWGMDYKTETAGSRGYTSRTRAIRLFGENIDCETLNLVMGQTMWIPIEEALRSVTQES